MMAREMKDSGIQWIGEIPKEWGRCKIKNICLFIGSGTTPASNNKEFYEFGTINWIQSGDIYGKSIIENVSTLITETALSINKALRIYKSPFITIAMYGGSVGNTAISNIDACTNQACCCIKPNKTVDLKFLYYWIDFCKTNFLFKAEGGGQTNISQEKIKNQIFMFPMIREQKEIAYYLDKKCAKIEKLKLDIQSQISILEDYSKSVITEAVTKGLNPYVEMKDSGIAWIGERPKRWEIVRGKYILTLLSKSVKEDDGVITCFRDGEVTLRNNRREGGFTMSDKEIGYQGIDVGDLVVHGMDGFAGAIGISDSRGKGSPVLNVLDTIHNKKYIMYYLRSMAYSNVFTALATGIRVRSCDLRWNKLAELFYPIPSKKEQDEIVAYIDKKIFDTNNLIERKRDQLDVLEQYKKSLIYEYVTGKKEVFINDS